MAAGSHEDTGAMARFWQLVEARGKPEADRRQIDQVLWDEFGQALAILFTDLAGFSQTVADHGITHFLEVLLAKRQVLTPIVAAHGGEILESAGDSLMIAFPAAATAARAAVAMHQACDRYNALRPRREHLRLCLGVGFGHVLRAAPTSVFGHEVNLASKLGEDLAREGETLLTPAAVAHIGELAGMRCEPVRAAIPHFRLVLDAGALSSTR